MRIKKRGISPLIASVLLIGFVIAVAAMIFFWWGDFVKQKAIKEGLQNDAQRACLSSVDLEVKDAKILDDGNLELVINNRGSQRISGFRFRIKDDSGISLVLSKNEVGAISQETVLISSSDFGDSPTEVEVLPIIVKSSEEGSLAYTCTNQNIKRKIE